MGVMVMVGGWGPRANIAWCFLFRGIVEVNLFPMLHLWERVPGGGEALVSGFV